MTQPTTPAPADPALAQRVYDAMAAAVTIPGAEPNDEETAVLRDLTAAVLAELAPEHAAHEARAAWDESRPAWVDGAPVQRRVVRETTTYTVEPEALTVARHINHTPKEN